MADITCIAAAAETRPRRRLLMRIFKALEESRRRQAQREINRYGHLLPDELERAASTLSSRTEDGLPFIR